MPKTPLPDRPSDGPVEPPRTPPFPIGGRAPVAGRVRIVHPGGPASLASVWVDGKLLPVQRVELLLDAADDQPAVARLTIRDVEVDAVAAREAPRLRVDREADAAYLTVQPGARAARTVEISDGVSVDYDEHGRVVGIELLHLGGGA